MHSFRNFRSRWTRCFLLTVLTVSLCAGAQQGGSAAQPDMASKIRIGDRMPAITVETLQGGNFSLTAQKGKVVVVNFWATWCGPCKLEMPQLEKDVWERNKANPDFAMIAISREEPKDTVATFAGKHPEFTFPLALDSQRSTYKLFADAGIPRTYVVDRRGVVVFESMGAGADDFSRMQEAVKKALAAR